MDILQGFRYLDSTPLYLSPMIPPSPLLFMTPLALGHASHPFSSLLFLCFSFRFSRLMSTLLTTSSHHFVVSRCVIRDLGLRCILQRMETPVYAF